MPGAVGKSYKTLVYGGFFANFATFEVIYTIFLQHRNEKGEGGALGQEKRKRLRRFDASVFKIQNIL